MLIHPHGCPHNPVPCRCRGQGSAQQPGHVGQHDPSCLTRSRSPGGTEQSPGAGTPPRRPRHRSQDKPVAQGKPKLCPVVQWRGGINPHAGGACVRKHPPAPHAFAARKRASCGIAAGASPARPSAPPVCCAPAGFGHPVVPCLGIGCCWRWDKQVGHVGTEQALPLP